MSRRSNASMSSVRSGLKGDLTRPREYLWGLSLTKKEPEHVWSGALEEDADDRDFLEHTLFLRHAVLGEEAEENERNLVAIETKCYNAKEINQPLFSLTLGKNDSCPLDLNFGQEQKVIFRLVTGSGPVHIVGQELVEPPPPENLDETEDAGYDGTEDEVEEEEEDLLEEEEEESESEVKGKKRKGSRGQGGAKKKKTVKAEETSDEEDEESMEEEEEEDSPVKKKHAAKSRSKKGKKEAAVKSPAVIKKSKKKTK